MWKKVVIVLVLLLLAGGGTFGYFIWKKKQEFRNFLALRQAEENNAKQSYPKNKKMLEDYFVHLKHIHDQITGLENFSTVNNGYSDYLVWLNNKTKDTIYNFRLFPWEIMYQSSLGWYNDSLPLNQSWPWSVTTFTEWNNYPYTDTNFTSDIYARADIVQTLQWKVSRLPSKESEPYLHILYRTKDNGLDLFDKDLPVFTSAEDESYSTKRNKGVFKGELFEGFLLIYNQKDSVLVKAFPLIFGSSYNLSYELKSGSFGTSSIEAGNKFREVFAADLGFALDSAFFRLAQDSLKLKKEKISLNKW